MDKKSDGGAAFPTLKCENKTSVTDEAGMSLRDYFAAKAMQGQLSVDPLSQIGGEIHGSDSKLAAWSYQIADAMIAERNK